MTEGRATASEGTYRKLTDEEKERIREEIRKRYGNQKLFTPALMLRLASMVLIILFSIGIIMNLKRRSQQADHVPTKRVIITIDTGKQGVTGKPVAEEPPLESKEVN